MEMADMGDSKSLGEIYAGSSPVFPTRTEKVLIIAHSPSGKVHDFESCIHWFESSMGSSLCDSF